MIRKLDQIEELVLSLKRKYRVAVAWPQDINSIMAVGKAVDRGLISPIMIGNVTEIINICKANSIDATNFAFLETENEIEACSEAVRLARIDAADIVMKGLVGTDKFLKAVMDKDRGLMIPGAVLSYVCALEIPAYSKLLFITDPAVIPCPNLEQKVAMSRYAVDMARKFGIERPKIALVGASEKMSRHFSYTSDYAEMLSMAKSGQIDNCEMDGPLDIFLACDRASVEIKGVETPVNGEADILLFPSLESSNPFYKGLMLFAHAELAGLISGTEKPVIVMSRSESEISKYYCIALSCLMST